MKTPVTRDFVLTPTVGTHDEVGHCCAVAIVRELSHDGEPWPARRARHERVAIAPVVPIAQLGETAVAGCEVGNRHQLRAPVPETRIDGKRSRHTPRLTPGDQASRGCATDRDEAGEIVEEACDSRLVAFDIYEQALKCVANGTTELVLNGKAVHRRPKTYSLDAPFEGHRTAGALRDCRGGGH
jgi:hypothetical protein